MAIEKYSKCDVSHLTFTQLLNSLLYQNTDGTFGFRFVVTPITECDDLTAASQCGMSNLSTEQAIRSAVVLDECGNAFGTE